MGMHSIPTASTAARAKSLVRASALALGLAWSTTANATLVTEYFTFSGVPYGNIALATGWVTFDIMGEQPLTSVIGVNGAFWSRSDPFSVTVTGANIGNGTFSSADFGSVDFTASGPLDFTKDLVGQSNFLEFNLFGEISSGAPSGFAPSVIGANEGYGDKMQLTSMSMSVSAVPEPGNLLGLACLVGGAVFLRRRRDGLESQV